MPRPVLCRILPPKWRERLFFRHYRLHQTDWPELFQEATLSLAQGVHMHDLVPGDIVSGCIAFTGFYEWTLSRLVAARARESGGLLADVGANMGYFSLIWAAARPGNRALAIEASPRNAALLRNNAEHNQLADRIEVIEAAAANQAGSLAFDPGPAGQTGWGSVAGGSGAESLTVPAVTLDEMAAGREIAFLKLDVEGFEFNVIKGARELLRTRRIQTIYFEEDPHHVERQGRTAGDVAQFLSGFGYSSNPLRGDSEGWLAEPR